MDCTGISKQMGRMALHERVGNFTGKFLIESEDCVNIFLHSNGKLCYPAKIVGVSPDFQTVLMRDVDNTVLISFSLDTGAQVQWTTPTCENWTVEFIGNDGLLILSGFGELRILKNGEAVAEGDRGQMVRSTSWLLRNTSEKDHEFRCMHLTKDLHLYTFNATGNTLMLDKPGAQCHSITSILVAEPGMELYPRHSTLTTDTEGKYVALSVGVGHHTTHMHMIKVYTADLQQLLFSLSGLVSSNPVLCAIDSTGTLAYTLQYNPWTDEQEYPQLLVLQDVNKGTSVSSTVIYVSQVDVDAQWKTLCVKPNGDVVVFRSRR